MDERLSKFLEEHSEEFVLIKVGGKVSYSRLQRALVALNRLHVAESSVGFALFHRDAEDFLAGTREMR
jgi:hypothetical protein